MLGKLIQSVLRIFSLALAFTSFWIASARGEGIFRHQSDQSNHAVGQKLRNPINDMVNFPIQFNVDFGAGPQPSENYLLKLEPLIPFSIDPAMTFVLRPIFEVQSKVSAFAPEYRQTGLGDFEIQTYFVHPDSKSVIWGLGLHWMFPTATGNLLGQGKWSLGPDFGVAKYWHHWTFSLLGNFLWSYAGSSARPMVNQVYFQPAIAYTWSNAWSLELNSETYYYFSESPGNRWSAPIHLTATKVVKLAGQQVSFALAFRYYVQTQMGGPDFGLRFNTTLVFPK